MAAQQRVLARIDRPGPKPDFAELAEVLGLAPHEPEDEQRLTEMLLSLARSGYVVASTDGRYRRVGKLDVVGRVSFGASRHFALIVPALRQHRPVKVRTNDLRAAREGDLVHAVIYDDRHPEIAAQLDEDFGPRRGRKRKGGGSPRRGKRGGSEDAEQENGRDTWYWARIEQVLRKRPQRVIGVYHAPRGKYGPSVKLMSREMGGFLEVKGDLPKGTRQGSIVDIEIVRAPEHEDGRRGRDRCRVLEALGHVDNPEDDELTVVAEYGLRMSYDEAAEAELDELIEMAEEELNVGFDQEERLDLTHLRTITVDPADARDHDDAISIERHDDGTATLGIHIADVSHYVRSGAALDVEARERGCTVYFPVRTLHMLPTRLAREVCSLIEGKTKLAKSVLIRIDEDGKVLERKLVRSLVNIDRFLTYGQVLRILQGRHSAEDDLPERPGFPDWLVEDLWQMRAAADKLLARRRREGSFLLDIPRPKVVLNEAGTEAIGVERESSGDISHNLIEEFMLLANRAVASFLLEHHLPYIARVHPPPKEDDIEDFVAFLGQLGYRLDGEFTPESVQALLDEIAEEEGGQAVHLALLKSMQRARYDAEPALHYALQFPYYTHFTSPIRRYPDLIAHQILDAYLDAGGHFAWHEGHPVAKPRKDWRPPEASVNGRYPQQQEGVRHIGGLPLEVQTRFEMELPTVAHDSTEAAMRAEYAETRTTQIKILRMIEAHHLDRVLEATVTGTTRHGIFCQLDEFLIEGLVPTFALEADAVDSDGPFGMLVAYGGHVVPVHVGDRLTVRVVDANPVARELELELAKPLARRTGRRAKTHSQAGRHGKGGGGKDRPKGGKASRRHPGGGHSSGDSTSNSKKKPHRGKAKSHRRGPPSHKGRGKRRK